MIVRTEGGVLHLITQAAHAGLARRVMERWVPLHDAERRASILLAVEEHDNGWHEPDATPSIDPATGRVLDFVTAPAAIRQGVWPRGVARLAAEDAWAAALVAEHAITIYDRYRADAGWQHFFEEMQSLRQSLLAMAGLTFAQLRHDYAFVRLGDLISLIFCNRWNEAQTFDRWTMSLASNDVVVSPDAFGGREIPVAVTAREIKDEAYASDAALHIAMRTAPVITLRGVVRGE
jgi:hypothetical protein